MQDPRPDILLIMTDQHAARVMGCAGDDHAVTPALDALAKKGTRFENCYCNAPLCVPSRMAFLTGLEPHVSGVLNNDNYLASDIPTFAHALGAAGYDCHLVGRMHFYGPDQLHGFAARPIGDIGASYPGAPPPDIGPLTGGRGNRGPELAHSGAGVTSYQAHDIAVAEHAEETLARLRRQREETGRPFLALVSFFCPHPPYIARRDDYRHFDGHLPPPRLPPDDPEHPAITEWRRAGGVVDVPAAATRKSRAGYYGLVRMIDRLVARVLAAVEGHENLVSIYTSDHGECLGERGLWWKSVMFDQSSKVPLIVRAPDLPSGTVDKRVCSLMDLSATLLGWAGTALPGHSGSDLRQATEWPDRCFSSYYGGLMNIRTPEIRHRMLRDGRYKLIWFDGYPPLLFELETDPDEKNDLSEDPAHTDRLQLLKKRLMAGWNPDDIRRIQARDAARIGIIRDWVRKTAPPEPLRWLDPEVARNRYE